MMKFILNTLFFFIFSLTLAQPKAILDKTSYNFWLSEPVKVDAQMPLIVF